METLHFIGTVALGGVLGGILGYVGKCSTGTCPLTANPWRGGLVGMAIAALFASVQGVPHLVLYRDGKIADSRAGYIEKAKLAEWQAGFGVGATDRSRGVR